MSEENPPNVPGVPVDLDDPSANDELVVELTRAQVAMVYDFLAQNIQPKGYVMISFAHDLFTRLLKALETPSESLPEGDAFNPSGDF